MRVLVCGSRTWTDTFSVWTTLDGVLYRDETAREDTVLITGGAKGADRCAYEWGMCRIWEENNLEFPANWEKQGKRAGYIRNQQMLDEGKPDVVFAFRSEGESRGTDMMIELASKAGVPVYVVTKR